jgi:hypothetical protein
MKIVFCTGSLETIPSNPPKTNLLNDSYAGDNNDGLLIRPQTLFKSAENQSIDVIDHNLLSFQSK